MMDLTSIYDCLITKQQIANRHAFPDHSALSVRTTATICGIMRSQTKDRSAF